MAWAWHFSAFAKISLGEPEVAIEHAAQAMRLSPQDPQIYAMQFAAAAAYFFAGRFDEALSRAEEALRRQPNFFVATCIGAASAALLGKVEAATKLMQRLRQLNPTLRLSNLRDAQPFRRQEDLAKLAEGLRQAGLPA
jgi:tetratricopeptide (TPR) repeat protein